MDKTTVCQIWSKSVHSNLLKSIYKVADRHVDKQTTGKHPKKTTQGVSYKEGQTWYRLLDSSNNLIVLSEIKIVNDFEISDLKSQIRVNITSLTKIGQ